MRSQEQPKPIPTVDLGAPLKIEEVQGEVEDPFLPRGAKLLFFVGVVFTLVITGVTFLLLYLVEKL